ncbi:hypothetical protein CCB80_10790 [Armatimonadetes bacterium Uphvl-Ar1]|nr:hypothetical protein CCB80_10790 [Armatimonadetes bacterium Uphvl-Ar1]
MSYQALFRKYRSQSFDDLVGQDHVVQTLRNSIAKGKIAQAYLFTGPRGTGKTSTARLLAKALNCTGGRALISLLIVRFVQKLLQEIVWMYWRWMRRVKQGLRKFGNILLRRVNISPRIVGTECLSLTKFTI